ncbi:MAG: hypothetical protein Kow0031_00440 [Anaerolineae bacterium]
MPSKLDYLQQKTLNPGDELRDTLATLESMQPRLKRLNRPDAEALLAGLDRADALLAQLETGGANMASERGRFESIQGHLRQRLGPVLKALGGPAALADLRPSPPPPRDSRWWWYIHEDVAAQQKRQVTRLAIGISVVLGTLLLLYVLMQTVFAPSPEAVARMEAENDALLAMDEGDPVAGLAAIDHGLTVAVDDPGLLVMRGVLLELLNRQAEADDVFTRARQLFNDDPGFFLGRGQVYYRMQQPVKAEADARSAIKLKEDMAAGWLLLAQSLEAQGQRFAAINAYEQAGELAVDSGQDEIVVLARLALGRIMAAPEISQ